MENCFCAKLEKVTALAQPGWGGGEMPLPFLLLILDFFTRGKQFYSEFQMYFIPILSCYIQQGYVCKWHSCLSSLFSVCVLHRVKVSCKTSDLYIRRNAQQGLSSIDLDTDKTVFNLWMFNLAFLVASPFSSSPSHHGLRNSGWAVHQGFFYITCILRHSDKQWCSVFFQTSCKDTTIFK